MRAVSLLLVVLAATAFAGPPAAGHGSESHGYEQMQAIGGLFVFLRMPTNLVLSDTPTEFQLEPSVWGNQDPGITGMRVRFESPTNASTTVTPLKLGLRWIGNATFPETGTWRANVTILPNGSSADYTFAVWKNAPWVVDSAGASTVSGDLFVIGRPAVMTFRVTHMDTFELSPAPGDATARVERWTEDHVTKLNETTEPLHPVGPGRFELRTVFREAGMYHVHFASPTLGLAYDDRPYVHAYALTPEAARDYGILDENLTDGAKETPPPAAPAVLAVVLALALALRARR